MFTSLLIANRGEIACRVLRTARRLGMRTIAVYSDADAGARHVRMADEALRIGAASARESYLHIGRVVAAARQCGAQAIHPGYGFLSESADFAQACADAGICFVGPPVAAIRTMGSKSEAKMLLQGAGIPLTPGYHGPEQGAGALAEQALRIGFPVLIKASAGGGGKGMRRVDQAGDFADALAACRREALGAFGSDQVLIEKYIEQARHIEIQIFADSHGNFVHLFERDCSVQRRHQKVIEEAPAPALSAQRRAAMASAALAAARAVGYIGAGTVEFLVPRGTDDDGFYFMEMNTRLQVEHPVTEMITGTDLVEWQLRVAAGQTLPRTQEQLAIDGHAIEARIYAEDPDHGFAPATGMLHTLRSPPQSKQLRWDAGVEQGDEIGPDYDPMIAKLIVWDKDREGARVRLRAALAQTRIVGVANNVAYLGRLADTPSFAGALLDTGLLVREAPFLAAAVALPPRELWLLAALAQLRREALGDARLGRLRSPWGRRDSWRANRTQGRVMHLAWHSATGTQARIVEANTEVSLGAQTAAVLLMFEGISTDCRAQFDASDAERWEADAIFGAHRLRALVVFRGSLLHMFAQARQDVFEVRDLLQARSVAADSGEQDAATVLAPMPGKVIALLAEAGSRVERDAPLLIVEAMKMEHTVRAPRSGLLRSVRVHVGDQVAMGEQLIEFEPDGDLRGRS